MRRYFFDVVSAKKPEHDYKGELFPSENAAREVAELIAIDLEQSAENRWFGWTVCVRDAHGNQYGSFEIKNASC